MTIDRVDDQLHHWQSNCRLSCCYCNTRRIHTRDDHIWHPTRRRDLCVGDELKPAVMTFESVYAAKWEMFIAAYETCQIGLRTGFGKLCHTLRGAMRNGTISRLEYVFAQKIVGETDELRHVHRAVIAPRSSPPQPKRYQLGLGDFDALPNPKGVHNRQGKLWDVSEGIKIS